MKEICKFAGCRQVTGKDGKPYFIYTLLCPFMEDGKLVGYDAGTYFLQFDCDFPLLSDVACDFTYSNGRLYLNSINLNK